MLGVRDADWQIVMIAAPYVRPFTDRLVVCHATTTWPSRCLHDQPIVWASCR
jgi:hypothetical protein